MAKITTDHYEYKSGGTRLAFSFEKGKREKSEKKAFATLLRTAAADLEKEIANN
tara:strand:- start:1188 stop:1349 length:162 start_codon:yes stop_codon:yes gene_type:complete